jgi:ABC-type transport system involved in multi-copper enzyme maturation permease subunit
MWLAENHFSSLIAGHLPWILAVLIVVIGLLASGTADFVRLFGDGGYKRAWAISSVCFQESIRRRILWMIPLAILGVIVAVQLINPLDELDAIRQTVKYALFTCGALVVMATIILACTNLPREIENRVIYTIVTKPTTRLEIVLGKIIGFARVSGTILLIMGVFTLVYAQLRSNRLLAKAEARLETLSTTDAARPALEHYVQRGLLECKTYVGPVGFDQYARLPKPGDSVRWLNGGADQALMIPFDLPDDLFREGDAPGDNGGLRIDGWIDYAAGKTGETTEQPSVQRPPFVGEAPDATEFGNFSLKQRARPNVEIEVLGSDRFEVIAPTKLADHGVVMLSRQHPPQLRTLSTIPASELSVFYQMPRENRKRIYLRITGGGGFEYGTGRGMIRLFSPRLKRFIDSPPADDSHAEWPEFHGREILGSQQLACGAAGSDLPVGIFHFRGAPVIKGSNYPLELRAAIEGGGSDIASGEVPTTAILDATNVDTGRGMEPMSFTIESNRPLYFSLPTELLGSNFDVHLRCIGPGHYLQFHNDGPSVTGLQLVSSAEPFVVDLAKSLLIIWMLSLLVVIIAIFCSTFVSWPIAVVLTSVFLIVHWGATELGDTSTPGLGASMARDLGVRDAATSLVFGHAVEGLTSLLNAVAKVTPDIEQFSAIDDISRNVSIQPVVLRESLDVLGAFGIALTMLAYMILDRKEVAP